MTNEQINIAIAEACGWKSIKQVGLDGVWHGWREAGPMAELPDYCRDLNAMHEEEKGLENPDLYEEWLESLCNGKSYLFHATARHRAEAFLRTIGKWKEAAK